MNEKIKKLFEKHEDCLSGKKELPCGCRMCGTMIMGKSYVGRIFQKKGMD